MTHLLCLRQTYSADVADEILHRHLLANIPERPYKMSEPRPQKRARRSRRSQKRAKSRREYDDHYPQRIQDYQQNQSCHVDTGVIIADPTRTSDEVIIRDRQRGAEAQIHAFDERFVDEISVSTCDDAAEDASNISPGEFLNSAVIFRPWLGNATEEIDLCVLQVSARHLHVEDK